MFRLEDAIASYLEYCEYQKNLNSKTLKAYRIDLNQFHSYMLDTDLLLSRTNMSNYITYLHKNYKPKSSKRKIASIKAFFSYLEYEDILSENPFSRLKVKSQEPFLLPRTISMQNLQKIFVTAYQNLSSNSKTPYQQKSNIRDIAVLELLFATGLRVSELCSLKQDDMELEQGTIRIYGKGSKERVIQLTNVNVLTALGNYRSSFEKQLLKSPYFFLNRSGNHLSEQSVRFMINRYVEMANIPEHITPHMFRHTFATMLLEEDVDIRYIQQILGHSSIVTTQIYTHVTSSKQREILTMKHPRNRIVI